MQALEINNKTERKCESETGSLVCSRCGQWNRSNTEQRTFSPSHCPSLFRQLLVLSVGAQFGTLE